MTNETTASQPKATEVTITVAGPVGCAKSALLGEIEIMLKALGVPVRYADEKAAQAEKNGTHADWTASIEMYKPSVVLVESIDSRAPAAQASATIQAAPIGWTAKRVDGTGYGNILYSDPQCAEIAISHNGPAAPKYEIAPVFAATIQEPVMVAEPVGVDLSKLTRYSAPDEYPAGGYAPMSRTFKGEYVRFDDLEELVAAPMVADPAGVAKIKRTIIGLRDGWGTRADADAAIALLDSLAATVKAVPSEALEGACTVCTGKGCSHCDGMGLEPRKVVGYAECRCILKQYCDGQCRPIFADQQPVTLAAPLAGKTGGGE